MSPASYLTAPSRDAARIVAPAPSESAAQSSGKRFGKPETSTAATTRRYHAGVATAVWIALAFLLVALVATPAVAGLRALKTWRSLRSFAGAIAAALDDVMDKGTAAEEHATALTANAERLAKATEHLQASLAQLALLRSAADEARATVARFRGAVPTK